MLIESMRRSIDQKMTYHVKPQSFQGSEHGFDPILEGLWVPFTSIGKDKLRTVDFEEEQSPKQVHRSSFAWHDAVLIKPIPHTASHPWRYPKMLLEKPDVGDFFDIHSSTDDRVCCSNNGSNWKRRHDGKKMGKVLWCVWPRLAAVCAAF